MASTSPCANFWAPTSLSYATASFSGVLSFITTVGNCLIILAVIKDPLKKLRTPFMYFLVNLAFSDLVVGGITMPTSVITHTMEAHGTKKKVHVKIIQLSYFMSSTASILSMAALCVDRYVAVKSPMMYRRYLTFKMCISVSAWIWICSLSFPFLFFVVGYMNYLMIFAHTAIIVTIVIMIFTYRNIYTILRQQSKRMKKHVNSASETKRTQGSERRVTKVFLLILSCVIICYTPAIVSIYILKFCPQCDCVFRHILRDLQFLCIVSNSCINPFVCTIQLKPFKDSLLHIFGRKQQQYVNDRNSSALQSVSSETKGVDGVENAALETN